MSGVSAYRTIASPSAPVATAARSQADARERRVMAEYAADMAEAGHDGEAQKLNLPERVGVSGVIDGKLVRVLSWYDNEWGFSNRMVDTAGAMGKLI